MTTITTIDMTTITTIDMTTITTIDMTTIDMTTITTIDMSAVDAATIDIAMFVNILAQLLEYNILSYNSRRYKDQIYINIRSAEGHLYVITFLHFLGLYF